MNMNAAAIEFEIERLQKSNAALTAKANMLQRGLEVYAKPETWSKGVARTTVGHVDGSVTAEIDQGSCARTYLRAALNPEPAE